MSTGPDLHGYCLLHHLREVGLKQFHRTVFTAAVVVYLITAWNSTGFHNADEHYQIIEFAQWKLGEPPRA